MQARQRPACTRTAGDRPLRLRVCHLSGSNPATTSRTWGATATSTSSSNPRSASKTTRWPPGECWRAVRPVDPGEHRLAHRTLHLRRSEHVAQRREDPHRRQPVCRPPSTVHRPGPERLVRQPGGTGELRPAREAFTQQHGERVQRRPRPIPTARRTATVCSWHPAVHRPGLGRTTVYLEPPMWRSALTRWATAAAGGGRARPGRVARLVVLPPAYSAASAVNRP